MELVWIDVREVDDSGQLVTDVSFDPDDLDAAYAELDDRYVAGEGAPYAELLINMREFRRASAARDWDTVARLLPDDFTLVSHRRLVGTETPVGRDEYLATRGAVDDLGLRGDLRLDHLLRISSRAAAGVVTWFGTLDGGEFETSFVVVYRHDGSRFHSVELFDVDQLDAALARYEELSTEPTTTALVENAATRAVNRGLDALAARDWERFAALHAAEFRNIDRRKLVQVELDRDQYLEKVRPLFEMAMSRFTQKGLATRGNRLSMGSIKWEGSDASIGPSELGWLAVCEVDDQGEQVVLVQFDPDDLDAAYAELDARYDAGEAAPYRQTAVSRVFRRAFAARDWDTLATVLAPDLVVNDHRLLGWETLHGPRQYIEALRSLVDLAPDARLRIDHVEMSDIAVLYVPVWVGSREGGAFETPSIVVAELDTRQNIQRFDQYDLEQLAQARARFAELRASPERLEKGVGRDPLRIPPNAATRARDRSFEALVAGDWAAMRALTTEDFRFEDRGKRALVSGGVESWIESIKFLRSEGGQFDAFHTIATAGDRLALDRTVVRGAHGEGGFEIDQLILNEVDANGKFRAVIRFDPDDRRAASMELFDRFARSDESPSSPAFAEALHAINDHDLDRYRPMLHRDFVFHDHRRTGVGILEGADAYVASIRPLFEGAPDFYTDHLCYLATEKHGTLAIARTSGTLVDGGEFESIFIRLALFRDDRLILMEQFELEDLDAARARFEELRPNPLRIPPNAATRAVDRFNEAFEARDWDAIEKVFAPTFAIDDRRRMIRVTLDREMHMASTRHIASVGTHMARTVLVTAGDRLALERFRWSGADDGSPFEVEHLCLLEADTEGRLVSAVFFDPDDRRAADLEMFERYVRSGEARWMPPSGVAAVRAVNDHDLQGLRAALPDDFAFHDHRRTGAGRLEGADSFVAWIAALFEQSPDVTIVPLYYVATSKHGFIAVAHMFGTLAAGGGEFESIIVHLAFTRGDHLLGGELFEIEDLDRARARFEELCSDPAL